MLHGDSKSVREGNHYWNWVKNYVADDYVQAVKTGSGEFRPPVLRIVTHRWRGRDVTDPCVFLGKELLERNAVLQSPSRVEELVKIFIHATKVSRPMTDPLGVRSRGDLVAELSHRWKLAFGRCSHTARTK